MTNWVVRFKPLLNFIARHEGTSNQPGGGYNTSLGYGAFTGGEKNLVGMTLSEIDVLQTQMLNHPENHFNSSALGRYQIVRKTLRGLKSEMGLSNSENYSVSLQDRLGARLIRRRGRSVQGLRNEWASLHNASASNILVAYDTDGALMNLSAASGSEFAEFDVGDSLSETLRAVENWAEETEDSRVEEIRRYHLEKFVAKDIEEVNDHINQFAEEGWTLNSIVPFARDTIVVMETIGNTAQSLETDESLNANMLQLASADPRQLSEIWRSLRTSQDDNYIEKFTAKIASWNLNHFAASEFLTLGGHHFHGNCAGLNGYPPEALWDNMEPTARILDALRDELGAAITFNSVYRTKEYNNCLDGAVSGSFHRKFRAVDFQCSDGNGPVFWATKLKAMRDASKFSGGIGVYPTFVHVDTRGYNANFGPWKSKVF
jgi:muramidase (phage lysozyme)